MELLVVVFATIQLTALQLAMIILGTSVVTAAVLMLAAKITASSTGSAASSGLAPSGPWTTMCNAQGCEIPAEWNFDQGGWTLDEVYDEIQAFNAAKGTQWTLHSHTSNALDTPAPSAAGTVTCSPATSDCTANPIATKPAASPVHGNRTCSKPGRFKNKGGCIGVIVLDGPAYAPLP